MKLVITERFRKLFASFYGAWSSAELNIDFAIGHFLKISNETAHLITASLDFSRKVSLLRALIRQSDHKNKTLLLENLNAIQNESKRNQFAHSYIYSTEDSVTFMHRSAHGRYKIAEYSYSIDEFGEHVLNFIKTAQSFHEALEVKTEDIHDFAYAAKNVEEYFNMTDA